MENRLEQIYQTASHLFINRGYARTQIKDIARDMGLSAGMLYVYFSGKKDILNFTLKCTVDPDFLRQDLTFPLDSALFADLHEEIMQGFQRTLRNFAAQAADPQYSFPAMVSDAFDLVARYGKGCLIIENNPLDVGLYFDYYVDYRKKFFEQIYNYISRFTQEGSFRPVEYPIETTQLIVETIAWWAMHVMNDAFERRPDMSLVTAKAVCLDNLIHAYQI